MTGSVYVMRTSRGVKIGRAANPAARLKSLQTASAEPIELCFCSEERLEDSVIENMAHRLLSEKRLIGKWFDVTESEAIAAITTAINLVDEGIKTGKGTHAYLSMRLHEELIIAIDDLRTRETPKLSRAAFIERALIKWLDCIDDQKDRK